MSDSPFKFLDAYEKKDKAFFFGREEETEALYQMTFDTRLILLYGGSGTGKTSLLQAGLANKFSETRWKDILVRRNDNINESLRQNLRRELERAGGQWPPAGLDPVDAIRQVHQLTFLPIYLLFDQFEELFILDPDAGEQQVFFEFIRQLLDANLPCKVILVLREEFLASLWQFEQSMPSLFDHRFRVERMRTAQLERVITGTLGVLVEREQLRVEEGPVVAAGILRQLQVDRTGVELAYLQVYLDRLYQLAVTEGGDPPVFNPALVSRLGNVEDVIGDFLDEQLQTLEDDLPEEEQGLPIRLLGAMVSDEQTKKVLSEEELERVRQQQDLSPEELESLLATFERMRILRRYTVNETMKLELSHDIIAKKVWERLPEVDKQLRQIKRSLEQRKQDYLDEKGSLLGEKELNAWAYYFPRLDLDAELEGYIRQSEEKLAEQKEAEARRLEQERLQIEKNRRLQRRIGRGLAVFGTAIGVLLVITLIAGARLAEARRKNINFLLEESRAQIRNLDYDNAWQLLTTAFGLKQKDRNVGKSMMEIAYFFNESGDQERALGMIDTLGGIFKQQLPAGAPDQAAIRRYLAALDGEHFQQLEKRYFPELASIAGGAFLMGCDTTRYDDCSPQAVPVHEVVVGDFRLARTETTVWQYYLYARAVGKELPEVPSWGWSGDQPMVSVNWQEAVDYTTWLGERRGVAFRLPSEPEWEYAARAGTDFIYSGSNEIDSIAWYDGNSQAPSTVAAKKPNVLGIYDLTGNVWEWTADPFRDYPLTEAEGEASSVFIALRGGAFDSGPTTCRVTRRLKMIGRRNSESYGFRVAADEEASQ